MKKGIINNLQVEVENKNKNDLKTLTRKMTFHFLPFILVCIFISGLKNNAFMFCVRNLKLPFSNIIDANYLNKCFILVFVCVVFFKP